MIRFNYIILIGILAVTIGCETRTKQLHHAVREGNVKRVKRLLDSGLSPDSLNEYGATPICYAAFEGYAEVARLLIKYGADVNKECNIVDGDMTDTWWPLYIAVTRGNYGNPQGHEAVAVMLIENGTDVCVSDEGGYTPLHHAHFSEHVTRKLIEKGADINAQNIIGETPLHFAVRLGDDDAVRVLLELGADAKVRNKKGETARDYAFRKNRGRIVEIIDSFQMKEND